MKMFLRVLKHRCYVCLPCILSYIGGVGILATGPLSAEETRTAIRTIRSNTDQPFGIGA